MKFYREKDLSRLGQTHGFGQSRLTQIVATLVLGALTGGIAYAIWIGKAPVLLWISVFFCGLFFLIGLGAFRASMRPSNWLLKRFHDRVQIKFRSYANHHFPEDDVTVVEIKNSEIDYIQKAGEVQNVPESFQERHNISNRFHYIDVHLNDKDTEELKAVLRKERDRQAPKRGISRTKALHYPVRNPEPGVVRLVWKGPRDRIAPGLDKALEILGRALTVLPQGETRHESWENMEGPQLEAFLVRLYEAGDSINAVKIASHRRECSLTEANEYIEKLAASRAEA